MPLLAVRVSHLVVCVDRHTLNDPAMCWEFESQGKVAKGGAGKAVSSEEEQRIDRLKETLVDAGGQRSWLDGWSAMKSLNRYMEAHWSYVSGDGKRYRSVVQVISHFGLDPGRSRQRTNGAEDQGSEAPYQSLRHDDKILWRRVRVFWELEDEWFCGVVRDFDREDDSHTVVYDDGDVQRWRRERPLALHPVLPHPFAFPPCFRACARIRTQSRAARGENVMERPRHHLWIPSAGTY